MIWVSVPCQLVVFFLHLSILLLTFPWLLKNRNLYQKVIETPMSRSPYCGEGDLCWWGTAAHSAACGASLPGLYSNIDLAMKHQTVASNFPLQVSNLDCNLEFSMNDGTNICVWMLNVTSSVFQHVNIVIIVARLKLIPSFCSLSLSPFMVPISNEFNAQAPPSLNNTIFLTLPSNFEDKVSNLSKFGPALPAYHFMMYLCTCTGTQLLLSWN